MLDQITPLILTYNEAPNIARTLESLRWASEIVVVDSYSTDDTAQIAATFPNVRVVRRAFDCHRHQWDFGLKETGIGTQWVLALDADYIITAELESELRSFSPRRKRTAIAPLSSTALPESGCTAASTHPSRCFTAPLTQATSRTDTHNESP
jgi:glycosyltransferase involved in cell wall biosynthesis